MKEFNLEETLDFCNLVIDRFKLKNKSNNVTQYLRESYGVDLDLFKEEDCYVLTNQRNCLDKFIEVELNDVAFNFIQSKDKAINSILFLLMIKELENNKKNFSKKELELFTDIVQKFNDMFRYLLENSI